MTDAGIKEMDITKCTGTQFLSGSLLAGDGGLPWQRGRVPSAPVTPLAPFFGTDLARKFLRSREGA